MKYLVQGVLLSRPEWDLNLGLSMSHILNYEAAALTSQPPWLDPLIVFVYLNMKTLSLHFLAMVIIALKASFWGLLGLIPGNLIF